MGLHVFLAVPGVNRVLANTLVISSFFYGMAMIWHRDSLMLPCEARKKGARLRQGGTAVHEWCGGKVYGFAAATEV
jgi:hypothetical protein